MEAKEASAEELSVYESLMRFIVYHEFMDRYDLLIERAFSGSRISREVKFYYECRDRQRHFMNVSVATRFSSVQEGLYFALYYQLGRAWLNIYRYIVGGSPAIRALRARIWNSCFTRDMRRYQRSLYDRMGDVVTLITGPSGTGKELVARAVGFSRFVPFDESSGRFKEDFAAVFHPLNLSALSPTLIESELFGHRKGAFTGALQDRVGYLQQCGPYGTGFLDEIGETDRSVQVKLLRVLQTLQFQRLGNTWLHRFVGKVMAATNRDLPEEISKGAFREDFFFRLCADRIKTPSLQEMLRGSPEELEILVRHVALRVAGPMDGPSVAEEASAWIGKRLGSGYEWPGNVPELEQCVMNVMIHKDYRPEALGLSRGQAAVVEHAAQENLTANQLLSRYAQQLYRDRGSYEETAKVMQVDR